jgi:hypothetical protein
MRSESSNSGGLNSRLDTGDGSIIRRIRLIMLLDAAENAGLYPLPIVQLHTLAYLANVLAPVWNMPILEDSLLKKNGGPFYPGLQRDLDRLVGMGVVKVSKLSHILDEDGYWRLEGVYSLNSVFSKRILASIKSFKAEENIMLFIQELAYALSALSDEEIVQSTSEDATYSNRNVAVGNLLEFGNNQDFNDWRKVNYSANAALRFEQLVPGGSRATYGELLHLYVRHLHTRLNGTV